MNEVYILGSAWGYLPVIFDVIYETTGIEQFKIFQNILVEDTSVNELKQNIYDFEVKPPGEKLALNSTNLVFGVDGPYAKHAVYSHFNKNDALTKKMFANIIHPSAYIASSASLSNGLLCEPRTIISSQSEIGFGVTIKRGVSIGHHNVIGDYVEINPGVIISGHTRIGRGCVLGVGAVIRNGITIGDNTFIGMGSLVTKDIPSGVVAYGNPCRVMRPNDKKPV